MVFSSTVHALPLCKGENKYKLFKSKKWHKCTGVEKQGEHKFKANKNQGECAKITVCKNQGEQKSMRAIIKGANIKARKNQGEEK